MRACRQRNVTPPLALKTRLEALQSRLSDSGGFYGLYLGTEEAGRRHLTTFTALTTTPNELTERLHDRTPVILEVDDYRTWLEGDDPRELLRPCPVDMLQCYPVSTRVNTPKNNAPDLIAPAR